MNKLKILILGTMVIFFMGCATNFSNPIRYSYTRSPTIHIVQQGSIPASQIYRPNFCVMGASTNVRAFFTPEIVAEMVQAGLTIISDITDKTSERYYDTLKNNYRWRNDIFIAGFENLSDSQIQFILQNSTKPQFDAQRTPEISQ